MSTETQTNKKEFVAKNKLIESGLQYGHRTKLWHPQMKPFIHSANKKFHIIDLNKSLSALKLAFKAAEEISARGGKFLFVGTNPQSKVTVKENAVRTESYYVDERWLGGLLTNWKTIQNAINRLKTLEKMNQMNFAGYTKKEALDLRREMEKAERALGGIKNMRRLPSAIFVSSVQKELIAIKEAKKLGIPVFGIVDTNIDPNLVDYPIPGNDDANKAVAFVSTIMGDAVAAGLGQATVLVNKSEDEAKVLGITDINERPELKSMSLKDQKEALGANPSVTSNESGDVKFAEFVDMDKDKEVIDGQTVSEKIKKAHQKAAKEANDDSKGKVTKTTSVRVKKALDGTSIARKPRAKKTETTTTTGE